MTNKDQVTYKTLYDFVDGKTKDIYDQLDEIKKQLNVIQGQRAMVPFLVSSAIGVFFTVINIVVSFIPRK